MHYEYVKFYLRIKYELYTYIFDTWLSDYIVPLSFIIFIIVFFFMIIYGMTSQ